MCNGNSAYIDTQFILSYSCNSTFIWYLANLQASHVCSCGESNCTKRNRKEWEIHHNWQWTPSNSQVAQSVSAFGLRAPWPQSFSLGSDTLDTPEVLQSFVSNNVFSGQIWACGAPREVEEIWGKDEKETAGSMYSQNPCLSELSGNDTPSHLPASSISLKGKLVAVRVWYKNKVWLHLVPYKHIDFPWCLPFSPLMMQFMT